LLALILKTMEKKEQLLICQHCGHRWNYKGSERYAGCPKCHYNVKNMFFEESPSMVQFNAGEKGVKIQDPSLATKHSPHGFIVDVYFRDGKAFCDYCQSSECKHVEYALSLPLVQKIFKKKGWKN
jgi:predicted  nucleic acid-binding Zn-ribbon protein